MRQRTYSTTLTVLFGTLAMLLSATEPSRAQPPASDDAIARSGPGDALPEPGDLFEGREKDSTERSRRKGPDRSPEPPESERREKEEKPATASPESSSADRGGETTSSENDAPGRPGEEAGSVEKRGADDDGRKTKTSSSPETARMRTLKRHRRSKERSRADDSSELRVEERSDSTEEGSSSEDGLFRVARRLFQGTSKGGLELEPYVDDPRWNRAMQLVVEDECDRALDRIEQVQKETKRDLREIPSVRYAVARAEMCGGAKSEGRKTMRTLARGEGVAAELARRRLGHDPSPVAVEEEAAESWRERLGVARNLAADGRLEKAIENLAELHDNLDEAWQRYKVRMTEANLLLRRGEVERAARDLLGVYEMARDWSVGDRIAEKIERVERRHGLEILPFGARVDRMRELIQDGEYTKAKQVSIRNAKIAGVGEPEITGWSLFRRGLQAERQRRRHEAAEMFERAEELVERPVIRSRLYFGWARALRRIDRDSEAIELYDRLCREYPQNHLCDDARFEAGLLHQYHDDHQKARAAFTEVVGLHSGSELVPKALWRGALSAYLEGDYEEVDRPLQHLVAHYPDGRDASGLPVSLKARYWLGAAAYKRGEMKLARQRLQETINRGALTWYGRLAAQRMRRMGEQPVVPLPPSELSNRKLKDLTGLQLPSSNRYRVAAEYARLGLYDDAIREVNRQLEAGPAPPKAHRFLANLHLVAGDVAKAHWMMHERIGLSTPTWENLRDWGIAYPVDYMKHGHRYGAKFGVSPFLVQGIMRQESGFRPAVSSYVGAVGLMQLMPGTANTVSDDFFDGSYLSRNELKKPDVNVRLGTAYIRALIGWVDGNVPMALAGYNAGPAPLESWFERYGEREIDAWVESITYEQARGYVRKVYTAYVRYAALYGGELPTMEFELPKGFGEWGEVPELKRDRGKAKKVSHLDRR